MSGPASLLWVAVLLVLGQVGLILTPYLADTAPVVLVALRPQPEFVTLFSSQIPFVVMVSVVAPLRWVLHANFVELGRWAGRGIASRSRTGSWLLARAENPRVVKLLLLSCLFHLGTPVDLVLGVANVDRRTVRIVLAIGALLTTVLFILLGLALSRYTTALIEWISQQREVAALVFVALAIISGGLSWRYVRVGREFDHRSRDNSIKD